MEKSKQLLPNLKLYQIHSVTQESEVLESTEVLKKLYLIKKENNIEIGLSTSGSKQIEVIKKALNIKINDEPLFTSFQVTFNVLDQSLLEIKDKIKDKKIIIKEALANGRILSNQYLNYSALQNETAKLATKYKVTIDAIAIRFCMDCFKGSTVLSGANNLVHLQQNLKANEFELENIELEKLKSFAINPSIIGKKEKTKMELKNY
jgi:aryl-alcohol dehydrogenase-like predicted oxidoreductase